jgi:hypothetical protein
MPRQQKSTNTVHRSDAFTPTQQIGLIDSIDRLPLSDQAMVAEFVERLERTPPRADTPRHVNRARRPPGRSLTMKKKTTTAKLHKSKAARIRKPRAMLRAKALALLLECSGRRQDSRFGITMNILLQMLRREHPEMQLRELLTKDQYCAYRLGMQLNERLWAASAAPATDAQARVH